MLRAADLPVPLPNGSFENGLEGWTVEGPAEAAKALPEATLLGDKGLRIEAPSAFGQERPMAPSRHRVPWM